MNDARAEYFQAVSTGDRTRALDVVRRLQQTGATPLDVMDQVIAPAQHRVGELWAADSWSVAQEHAATAVSETVLHVLGSQVPAPSGSAAPVVVSCVEQEWHALPALIVAEHLRAAGVPVSYLGANASAEHLVRHVHEVGPRAVALSCSLGSSLPRVRRQVAAVRATGTPVVVGGAAFDSDGRRAAVLGATGFARSGTTAVEALQQLPSAVSPVVALTHEGAQEGANVDADRDELTARLRERVVAVLVQADAGEAVWHQALLDHLPHLVGAVAGALVANDPSVLEEAVEWLDAVMRHREGPDDLGQRVLTELRTVLREYPAATRLLSGTFGAPGAR